MNLGASEVLFISILALLIFGPQKLPELLRMLGKAVGEFRRATSEVRDELMSGMDEPPSKPTDRSSTKPSPPGPR